MTMRQLARQERADFAHFLTTLEPEMWDAPSLCAGWRVRDVVAHVVSYDELQAREVLQRFATARFNPGKANDLGVAEYSSRSRDELIALVGDSRAPRGLPAAFGGVIALVDGLIHQQDIRRPLGMSREIPEERLARALRVALVAPPIGAFWRARGLRLVATDIELSLGRGTDVHGPAESLLMAVAGRTRVVSELSGPGQPTLAARIT